MVVRDVIIDRLKKTNKHVISDSEENENVLTGYENEPQYTEFERTYENKF